MVALSVRGEASRLVEPDEAVLSTGVAVVRGTRAEALRAVAAAADAVVADLASAGGRALTAGTAHDPLTWSRHSASTSEEWDGSGRTTGRTSASVGLSVVVRALVELDAVSALLARHEALQLQGVTWRVDDDNVQWPAVRAEAIAAAVRKARDYAAALGGELQEVEHVADVGLLARGEPVSANAMTYMSAEVGSPDAPSLDPVPQRLSATVEARFTATSRPL